MRTTSVNITATTQYILSTSGRPSSMRRYQTLLQRLLKLDIAYLPLSSPTEDGKISPEQFVMSLKGLNAIGGAISRDIKGADSRTRLSNPYLSTLTPYINVKLTTIKGTILPHLDEIDPLAREIGAVNTVIRRQDRLIGQHKPDISLKTPRNLTWQNV